MNCGLCKGTKNTTVLTVGSHKLVRCSECGLIYTSTFVERSSFYTNEDYFTVKNQYVTHEDELYRIFEPILDKIIRFKPEGTFLDIGTGIGTMLSVASKRGFVVYGVELSDWAAKFARETKGLNVFTGSLKDSKLLPESFDVVVINHVLEHVSEPCALLVEIHRILKKDGILVIGVPNFGSIMARLQKDKWQSIRPEEHIWHFSSKTLGQTVNHTGFYKVYFESCENHPICGWGPKALLKRIINDIAVLANSSEAMLLFAKKKLV